MCLKGLTPKLAISPLIQNVPLRKAVQPFLSIKEEVEGNNGYPPFIGASSVQHFALALKNVLV